MPTQGSQKVYELMLRSGPDTIEGYHTLHIYNMPLLINCDDPRLQQHAPDGTPRVLEIELDCDTVGRVCSFQTSSVRLREPGKLPNFHRAVTTMMQCQLRLTDLMRHNNHYFLQLCIGSVMRHTYREFVCGKLGSAVTLTDIGGGKGGMLSVWNSLRNLNRIVVVEPDEEAIREYMVRVQSNQNTTRRNIAHIVALVLRSGKKFLFNNTCIEKSAQNVVLHTDAIFLGFCLSQMVDHRDTLYRVVKWILQHLHPEHGGTVILSLHDHAVATETEYEKWHRGEFYDGVCIQTPQPCIVCKGKWLCTCANTWRAYPLKTCLSGTSMANKINEWAIDWEAMYADLVASLPTGAHCHTTRPFQGRDCHWVLRSFCLVRITIPTV